MMPVGSRGMGLPLRPMRYIILAYALSMQLASASLEEFTVSAKMNILHYVAKELAMSTKDGYKVHESEPKACEREPAEFYPDINFYVLKCLSDLKAITVHLEGKNVYVNGGQADQFDVYMSHTEEPQMKQVTSCPEGIWDLQDPLCTTYTLDIYRVSSDIATLAALGVSSSRLMYIKPDFEAGIQSYNTTVSIGYPFSISARAEQTKGRVGIQAPPGSGLDESRNGCHKAAARQTVWDFKGFNAVGQFKFVVCALAPDNIHMTHYELTVIVKPIYSVKLESLKVNGKGHKLEPDFHPDVQQYVIHVDSSTTGVSLTMFAEDPEADMTLSDGKHEVTANNNITSVVTMHDNSHLKVGEPPQWSKAASIILTSSDGGTTMTYVVDIKQHVSNYSYLKNLTMGDTKCVMDPPVFQQNITKYYCKFWWEDTKSPQIVPILDTDDKCSDCVLLVPSPTEYKKSHLSLQYREMKKRKWESNQAWSRPFLYGEYHTIPFQVLSADKFTHTTYEVTLERDAPWWMKAAFTRQVSQWATTAALVMAVTTASNFLALTSQIQFMDLTTEIHGTPEVYQEFADHLKAANFDLSDYVPDMGLPSFEDVKEMRDKMIKQMQDSFAVGAMKNSGTLILQYCYALEASGQIAANQILHKNKKAALDLRSSLEKYKGTVFKPTEKKEMLSDTAKEEIEESKTERRLTAGNVTMNFSTTSHLRGLKQLTGDVSGDVEFFRRLGEDDEDDKDKKKKDEGPKDGGSVIVVIEWTDHQWEDFVKQAKKEGVKETDFPRLRKEIPCHHAPIKEVVPFLYLMHNLELIRRMMHTYTGTFLIMVFLVFGVGGGYFWYWYTVMRTSQRRLKMLEPGTLSILVLDCGLVGFTKSATKMLVERCVVTFFFWKPSRLQVQGFVLFGIIVYPLLFVVITCSMIFTYTVGETSWCSAPPDEEEKTEAEVDNTPKSMVTDTTTGEDDDEEAKNQKHTVMVFNEDVEQWIDPAANEIKVTLEPPIPSWIPVAGEITTGHVRSCIPVLQPNGSAISFKTEDQEQVKVKETVNKQQLEQEAIKLEKELEAELMSKKHEAKHAANKKKKQEEKELMEKIKKRKEDHQRDLETAKTQLKTLGKHYFADEQEYLLHSDNWSSNFDDRLWVRDAKKEDEGKGFWLESKNGSEMTLAKLQSLPPQQQKDHFPLKITWKLYKLSNITEDKEGPSGRPSWYPEVEPKKDDLDEAFQYNVVRIGELLEDWGSRKDREDSEKLDKEEAFAIKSFLEGNIRREKRLLKYNIMQVAAHKGCLVPQEPFRMLGTPKSDTKEETIEDHKTKWWFDSEEEEAWETDIARKAHLEYTPEWQTQLKQLLKDRNISESAEGDAYVVKNAQDKEVKTANLASASEAEKRDNFPLRITFQRLKLVKMAQEKGAKTGSDKPPLTFWLDQFKENQHYIANASGQRLVYMGDSTSFFGWMKMGFGAQAGECEWMDEPEEGWDGFDKMLDQEGPTGKKYADKWQWIYFDQWKLPWHADEQSENEINLLGLKKVAKDDIPLYRIFERNMMKRYKDRVFREIPWDEKNEIRKFVWEGLLSYTELKLKLEWVKMQHVKFFKKEHTLDMAVVKPFDEILVEIEKPGESNKLPGETLEGGDELLTFCLMKFEDLYEDEEEPWWEESDKPEKNERKVMFDHGIFFKSDDEKFKQRQRENALIPVHGYYSSSCFTRFPNDTFGKKRYVLKKPDDPVESIARVEMKVQLKHVLPLMRYTKNFKVCVPINSLELPLRSNLAIILKESGNGEQFNYTVDRTTTLISIALLASNPPGRVCAVVFLCIMLVSFFNRLYTNWATSQTGEKEEEKEADGEKGNAPEKQALLDASGDAPQETRSGLQRHLSRKLSKAMRQKLKKLKAPKGLLDAFLEVDVFVYFLKCVVLFFLCIGQFDGMPPPLCAIACIVVCCLTMLVMNVGTFRKELNKQIESLSESVTEMHRLYRTYRAQCLNWLAGENPWRFAFIENAGGDQNLGMESVKDVHFVVPDLGLRLQGKATVDDLLPEDEKLKQQLLKYTAYYNQIRENENDYVISASDLGRYYQDIQPSFTVALNIDQVKLCAAIPPLAATLQCVNHSGSKISQPDFDSYKTLFYPEDWEEEHDHDANFTEALIGHWQEEVVEWLDKSLGAVRSERTQTKKIQDQIMALLSMPFSTNQSRNLVMIRVEHIMIPKPSLLSTCREKNFVDKKLYITILYESEDFMKDLPTERSSGIARSEPVSLERLQELMDVGGSLRKFQEKMDEEGDDLSHWNTAEQMTENMAAICIPQIDFKVPVPATVSKFKLMVWLQHDHTEADKKKMQENKENQEFTPPKVDEELVGVSDLFSLQLPDKETLRRTDTDVEVLGSDQADQRRLVFYNSWRVDMHKQLHRIQAADDDGTELGCWGRMKKSIVETFAPPITKENVMNAKGFVDISIRYPTDEEVKEDDEMMEAVKDVTAGSSEMNKKKLIRHLDRRAMLAKFFGMRMDRHCIHGKHNEPGLQKQLEKLEAFKRDHMEGLGEAMKETFAESTVKERRQQELLNLDIRRTLWTEKEMDKAIQSIKDGMEKWEQDKEKEAKTQACPSYHVGDRYRGLTKVTDEAADFDAKLITKLQKFKQDQARASKSILHYVIVADHLKPNKVWRPDAISPHVCGIVVASSPNVDEITVTLKNGAQAAFLRENSKETGLPVLVNARLAFQAKGPDAKKYYEAMEGTQDEQLLHKWKDLKHHKKKKHKKPEGEQQEVPFMPVHLYWDGFARWVISPYRGDPVPYGLASEKTDDKMHVFCYAKDNAISPDRLNTHFMVWDTKDEEWVEDEKIKCLSKYTAKEKEQVVTRAQQLAANARSGSSDSSGSGIFGEMAKAFSYIFSGTTSSKMSPEIKECLLGLEGANITVAWKDLHQDELAPFRKFLVDSFGTYYAAWVHLCRNTQIPRQTCIRNLARMLRRCREELDAAKAIRDKEQKEAKNAKFGAQKGFAQTKAMSKQMTRGMSRAMSKKLEEMTPEQIDKEKKNQEKKEAKAWSMFGWGKKSAAKPGESKAVPKIPHDTSLATLDIEADKEKIMLDYLKDRVKEDKTELVAAEVMEFLDKEKDGEIAVQEILVVAELVQKRDDELPKDMPEEVKEFVKFVRAHPKYRDEEQLWADLSEGFEIKKEEFVEAAKVLLLKFNAMQSLAGGETLDTAAKGELLFSKLDAQMSGGIGLHELIPMAGDKPEDAESSLAKFKLPLKFIKEIRIDAAKAGAGGGEDRLTVRFQVLPEFEMSPEWRVLKKALQPDWEPIHGFEYIQVAMLPEFLEMWKQVIKDCGMDTAQEWVRFYQGRIMDHPQLDGVYMRQGTGLQRWTDGKTYVGEWENHVYHGPGALYNSFEESQLDQETRDAKAIYTGNWQDGKRHGHGTLRWEQDNSDRQRRGFGDRQFSGVTKVYEGNFRYDLFDGYGVMRLEKAVAQSLRTLERTNLSPGKVPFPNFDPLYITSFEGEWDSDWLTTDTEARKFSPLYENLHPMRDGRAQRDLKLNEVNSAHMKKKDQKFTRYFGPDPLGVQAAGDPLPDLALAFYQTKAGDAKHMSNGTATYADFTVYEGEMKNGFPDGFGKMTQFDHEGGNKGKQVAYYEGHWQNGKFHGKGKYKTADGLVYTGEWAAGKRHGSGEEELADELSKKIGYSRYKGQWKNDKFHGTGDLYYADINDSDPKRLLFKGTFADGMREGEGKLYDKHADGEENRRLKLKCKFERDKIAASKKDQWVWAMLDGDEDLGRDCKYFFGALSQDGSLGSWGTLFSGSAMKDDAEFRECFDSDQFYDEIADGSGRVLKYTLYHGAFKDNLPDGFGLQHFQGAREGNKDDGFHGGTYTGEFKNGKRHGRGTWKALEGDWEFRPISTETSIQNFENDVMHGIGIVEDSQHVHENVIYTKGKCQMPFTELGPPKTGFESAALNDMMPQASRRRAMVTPLPTIWDASTPKEQDPIWSLLKGFGRKLDCMSAEGWEAFDPESELRFLRATARSFGGGGVAQPGGVTKTLSTASAITLPSMAMTTTEPQGAVALVREPTDLSLPEEDVLIKGGVGENEVINGVYFKLMHTFGVKAFKMVKRVGFYSTPITRYLYWDIVANAWTISEKPLEGVCSAPGCAFCQQDGIEHPSLVTKPWYVWHGYSGSLMAGGVKVEEEEEKKEEGFTLRGLLGQKTEVDIIKSQSIVGFQVHGSMETLGNIGKGLMLRIPMTLFGRPVYEFEGGGQYLYYLQKESKIADGQSASWEEFGAGVEPKPERLFEKEGYWAISMDIGEQMDSERCYGYCEDLAVTPEQIDRTWYVRFPSGYRSNPDLKFTPQEWVHEGTHEAISAAEAAELEKQAKQQREAGLSTLESTPGVQADTLEVHPAGGVGAMEEGG